MRTSLSFKQRVEGFWDKTRMTGSCWNWIGSLNPKGYGQYYDGVKPIKAHRFSYELFKGKIPEGLQLDHLCRNRKCVNPNHLEIVTNKENVLRGVGMSAANSRKTHCSKGHAFTLENTYNYRKTRACKKCRYEYGKKWRLKIGEQ